MAEGLLTRRLAELGMDAEVRSAGRLPGGRAVTPENLVVMRSHGVDLGAHRSREATAADVRAADLIIGMAREHVRDAVALAPEALGRAFTMKELARRGAVIGPRPPAEPVEVWLARAGAGREVGDLLGSSTDDDVRDPIGLSRHQYEAVAAEVAAFVERIVDLVWPRTEPSAEAPRAPAARDTS